MPYNLPVLEVLVKEGVDLIIVHDDARKFTPYIPKIKGVQHIYGLKSITDEALWKIAKDFNPDVIFISDSTIKVYNKIGLHFKNKHHIPVLSGCDTGWHGKRQWFNVIFRDFRQRKWYTHMMISGLRQYEYARKLGFSNSEILWPLTTADTRLFETLDITEDRYQATDFLYVGRFRKVKGIDYLLQAWKSIDHSNGEKLHLVGSGHELPEHLLSKSVVVHSFTDQKDLLEIARQCRAFILPSVFEPWGVVVQEFAAAGMPLIITEACGACPHFLINNYNGYQVKPSSVSDLLKAMNNIKKMSPKELKTFGIRSRQLSKSITSEMVAHNFLSVYDKKH